MISDFSSLALSASPPMSASKVPYHSPAGDLMPYFFHGPFLPSPVLTETASGTKVKVLVSAAASFGASFFGSGPLIGGFAGSAPLSNPSAISGGRSSKSCEKMSDAAVVFSAKAT